VLLYRGRFCVPNIKELKDKILRKRLTVTEPPQK
jgi:hypothetical protein